MKNFIANVADKFLTRSAKGVAKTGCAVWCNREEIPAELL